MVNKEKSIRSRKETTEELRKKREQRSSEEREETEETEGKVEGRIGEKWRLRNGMKA
jgi:hypothetical protein